MGLLKSTTSIIFKSKLTWYNKLNKVSPYSINVISNRKWNVSH